MEMGLIEFVEKNFVEHILGGFAVSTGLYMTSVLVSSKEDRIAQKKSVIKSIDHLLKEYNTSKSEKVTDDKGEEAGTVSSITSVSAFKDDYQFAENAVFIKKYLLEHRLMKTDESKTKKFLRNVKSVFTSNNINKAGAKERWGWALGMEILYDSILGFSYYTNIAQVSPLPAFGYNVWQVPAFWTGLFLGKYATKGFHALFVRTSEERKLDNGIKDALRQTNLLDIVANYEPSHDVKKQLKHNGISEYGALLTGAGKKALKAVGGVYTNFKDNYRENQEAKRKADEDYKQERSSRFDDLTKGM